MAANDDDLFLSKEDGEPLLAFQISEDKPDMLLVGSSDWVGIEGADSAGDIRIRVYRSARGFVVTGIAILMPGDDWALTGRDLRAVPLTRLQALLEHPTWSQAISEAQWHAREMGGPDLAPEAGYDISSVPIGDGPVPAPPLDYAIEGIGDDERPPDFYARVAGAWTAALAAGHSSPAQVLADANEVPTSTIHRWVRVARERGELAPSSRTSARRQSRSEGELGPNTSGNS